MTERLYCEKPKLVFLGGYQSPFADFVGTFPLVSRGKNSMMQILKL